MTDRDVKKLKRVELLELMIEQGEENERLKARIAQLEEELAQRVVLLDNAGSIAEASIGLSKVFGEAQDAADRYLESIRQQKADTVARCREVEEKTREACEARLNEAKSECESMLSDAKAKVQEMENRNLELQKQIQAAVDELSELDSVRFLMLHPDAEPEPAPIQEESKPSGWKRLFGKH